MTAGGTPPSRRSGRTDALELWVPAEELPAFNASIVDPIEVTAEFRPAASA